MRRLISLLALAACDPHPPNRPLAPAGPWPVPQAWKSETIPFPLGFAPKLAHRGTEELRFAPGFFDPAAPGYWSYAFVWRTEDAAALDAAALGAELTEYFRGLIDAVDKDGKIGDRDAIAVKVAAAGASFAIEAHVFDPFKTSLPLDLTGTAERRACPGGGALWVFVLAPVTTGVRAELEALARQAACGQPEPPEPAKKP
ncbi:MAG: hypothetical protein KF773_26110 [Deltaproteobacteria bacterium]|nr:hypothetical protein [Deltaproteobacteria bacterium]